MSEGKKKVLSLKRKLGSRTSLYDEKEKQSLPEPTNAGSLSQHKSGREPSDGRSRGLEPREGRGEGGGGGTHVPLCGLINMGNTCYISSVLQALRCAPGLYQKVVGSVEASTCSRRPDNHVSGAHDTSIHKEVEEVDTSLVCIVRHTTEPPQVSHLFRSPLPRYENILNEYH